MGKGTPQKKIAAAAEIAPEDVVWRSVLRNRAALEENATARGQEEVGCVQLVEDLIQFYENISHSSLQEKADRL